MVSGGMLSGVVLRQCIIDRGQTPGLRQMTILNSGFNLMYVHPPRLSF